MGNTINKHIRVDEEHWKRIEKGCSRTGDFPEPVDDLGHY